MIQELGARHEAAYLEFLRSKCASFADLRALNEQEALRETLRCMERGVEIIAQGSLGAGRLCGAEWRGGQIKIALIFQDADRSVPSAYLQRRPTAV